MQMSRRFLFLGMSSLALLAGCKTVTDGSTTSVEINVSKVTQYAQAGINSANLIIGAVAAIPGLSVYTSMLSSISTLISKALIDFQSSVGDSVTISYNDSNYKTLVDSILDNISKILEILNKIVSTDTVQSLGISDEIVKYINIVKTALGTVVNVYQIMIGLMVFTASSGTQTMTEGEALSTLNVK